MKKRRTSRNSRVGVVAEGKGSEGVDHPKDGRTIRRVETDIVDRD